jgi:hypothetical protein
MTDAAASTTTTATTTIHPTNATTTTTTTTNTTTGSTTSTHIPPHRFPDPQQYDDLASVLNFHPIDSDNNHHHHHPTTTTTTNSITTTTAAAPYSYNNNYYHGNNSSTSIGSNHPQPQPLMMDTNDVVADVTSSSSNNTTSTNNNNTDGTVPTAPTALVYTASPIPVPEPNINDVLLGRGGKNNQWSGNETLRELARAMSTVYAEAQKRNKPAIAMLLVQKIRALSPSGRYVFCCCSFFLFLDVMWARENLSSHLKFLFLRFIQ